MLTTATLERILARVPALTVGVVGDLFLDRYLDLDAALTEPSIETGLDAYQVVRVRSQPGAAGTVISNLIALGVKQVRPVAVIGDDGEGHELRQALAALGAVDPGGVLSWPGRRTPTYTKPMLCEAGRPPRELNRLDIKNRTPLPADAEERVLTLLYETWPRVDALLVLDQVSEPECGVITTRVRGRLAELAEADPGKFVLADSRERVWQFRNVHAKPNADELLERRRIPNVADGPGAIDDRGKTLARQARRPVFCTRGAGGITLFRPDGSSAVVPAYPVSGPIDPVGAGDSTGAAIACAVAAGALPEEAAAFGNLVASITVQQIGTTGTATPGQVRQRWREVGAGGR
ncbi:MAG TPA: PfkB family carbohydrate kinase [Gemmataceae bacterium]|nr:PfkB family carbohydrate kinase [Gemmataceae bacterium]